MLKYKIDVLKELKNKGYPTTRLIKEHIIDAASTVKYRKGFVCDLRKLDIICSLLEMQPGKIIEYVGEENAQMEN
jgi:putative transcriptional regulator